MYIKARWNKRYFAGSAMPRCVRRREGPLFRRVCPCVRSFSERRVCTHFACESKRGAFVREVENRDKKRFETAL